MKRVLGVFIAAVALFAANQPLPVCAETETIDLKALAKKARPAVMLLVVSDANGKEIATGTGFLVSSDGKLITNFHVIEGAASAVAKAENGGLFPVEGVLASDPKNDLVLLKIKAKELPFLTLGKSENIEVGTRIAVIGSPLGLEGTLSEGIVSAVRGDSDKTSWIQITAAISPGSSGSPVLNPMGQVIGVATLVVRGGQSLNFAVSIEATRKILAGNLALRALHPNMRSGKTDKDIVLSSQEYKNYLRAVDTERKTEALSAAQALIRRFPESALAFTTLSCAFCNLGFWEEATGACKEAIKLNPNDDGGWELLAGIYSGSGKIDEAIAAYRQGIELQPTNASLWMGLGTAYYTGRRFRDAGVACEKAVRIKPDYAEAWYELGLCYVVLRERENAEIAYRRLRELAPELALQLNKIMNKSP